MARLLARSLDPDVVAQLVADSVLALLGGRRSTVYRRDPASGNLLTIGNSGDLAGGPALRIVPAGIGAVGVAIAIRGPFASPDLLADARVSLDDDFRDRVDQGSFRSALAVPLLVQDEVIGALFLGDAVGRLFTEDDVRLAEAFADHAAIALNNADLYREAQRGRREADVVAALAAEINASLDLDHMLQRVTEAARELCGADVARIAVRDAARRDELAFRYWVGVTADGSEHLRVVPGKGLGGFVLETGQPYRTADVLEDSRRHPDYLWFIERERLRSEMVVPIRTGRHVEGLLYVSNRVRRPFTDRDESLCLRVADHAAIAMNNARLYDDLSLRATRLRTLAELNRLVSSSLDLERVLSAIARAAAELTGARLVSCWIANEATQTLERAAYSDEALGRTHPVPRVRFGEGGIGWVAVHRQPLDLPDIGAFGRMAANEWFAERGLRSALELPIVFQDRLLGVLAHFAAEPFRLAPDDRDLLDNFVSQAAVALRNAQLYEDAEARRREAEAAERRASLIAQEVEATSRAKDEFLAMLGHELRNPLSAISHAVHVMERLGGADDPRGRARQVATRQVQHLTALVDDLLDVARVTTGKIVLNCQPVDLAQIARQCISTVGASGRSDEHRVTVDARPAWIDADTTRVEQVVTNLLVNALKYTPPGGVVDVTVRPAGAEAVLEVRDTGIGIAPDALPRIFELFMQGERALDRAQGGLGVGLTLVRRLVELHGGRVEAASDGHGRGSRFTVRLPLAAMAPARAATAPPADDEKPRRILLVEDNADAREMLRALLALDGHEVHEAADGPSGVRAARDVQPDVALIDLGLPGLDGFEVARRIRAAPGGKEVRLVALTGYGQPEDRARSREAGFDAHLVKPVDPPELARAVAQASRRPGA